MVICQLLICVYYDEYVLKIKYSIVSPKKYTFLGTKVGWEKSLFVDRFFQINWYWRGYNDTFPSAFYFEMKSI